VGDDFLFPDFQHDVLQWLEDTALPPVNRPGPRPRTAPDANARQQFPRQVPPRVPNPPFVFNPQMAARNLPRNMAPGEALRMATAAAAGGNLQDVAGFLLARMNDLRV
jgi:hypothetical protein